VQACLTIAQLWCTAAVASATWMSVVCCLVSHCVCWHLLQHGRLLLGRVSARASSVWLQSVAEPDPGGALLAGGCQAARTACLACHACDCCLVGCCAPVGIRWTLPPWPLLVNLRSAVMVPSLLLLVDLSWWMVYRCGWVSLQSLQREPVNSCSPPTRTKTSHSRPSCVGYCVGPDGHISPPSCVCAHVCVPLLATTGGCTAAVAVVRWSCRS
jgi:hypothetical protein